MCIFARIGCTLFGVMRRSAHLAACKAGSDTREGEQSDPSDDDNPLRPWCSCQQPHGGNFMIMCDIQRENCHKWYHGMCVGISPEEGRTWKVIMNHLFVHHVLEFLLFLLLYLETLRTFCEAHLWMGLSFVTISLLHMITLFTGETTFHGAIRKSRH